MEEREVGITELKASLDECLEEVRNGSAALAILPCPTRRRSRRG